MIQIFHYLKVNYFIKNYRILLLLSTDKVTKDIVKFVVQNIKLVLKNNHRAIKFLSIEIKPYFNKFL